MVGKSKHPEPFTVDVSDLPAVRSEATNEFLKRVHGKPCRESESRPIIL